MRLDDSRRLTGPNLQMAGPGVIAEVCFEPSDAPEIFLKHWMAAIDQIGERLPFSLIPQEARRYIDGVALVCAAPIDALYAAVDANEWAVHTAEARCAGLEGPSIDQVMADITGIYAGERSAALLALQAEAERRELPFLWDDDEVSIGYGRFSRTWPRSVLPETSEVEWGSLRGLPVVLITGTNGKTTTARLVARMLQESGFVVGNSSTDGISVNGELVDHGDWTGPGAARAVLRHPQVEAAVLETARGGILRRGLGVGSCDAALVTNVSTDHLGEFGIFELGEMADVKGLVYSAVGPDGYRVINLDDPYTSRFADDVSGRNILTSIDGDQRLVEHVDAGGVAVFLDGDTLVFADGLALHEIIIVNRMPIARGGVARHDISNALGAVALAWSAGADLESIRFALADFGAKWDDNPGRGQLTQVDGVNVLLDFGHNPHGANAVLEMANGLREGEGRLSVCMAQAGDRTEEDLRELARVVARFSPQRVYLRDLPQAYHRGRTPSQMARIMGEELLGSGLDSEVVERAESEVDALAKGLDWARPGDLLVHLVHLERGPVEDALRGRGASLAN